MLGIFGINMSHNRFQKTGFFGYLFNMLSISEHADLHLGTRNMRQFHRATETFVLLRIIVLEPNLELNSLSEVAVLFLGLSGDLGDGLPQHITLKLTVKPPITTNTTTPTLSTKPISLFPHILLKKSRMQQRQNSCKRTNKTNVQKWKELQVF